MTADAHAAAYDAIVAEFVQRNAAMPPTLGDLGRQLLECLPVPARVLDLGCGPGRDMAWFEAAGATVVGLDVSAGMIRHARTAVRGRLVEADMRALPFEGASFEGVWCIASLLHVPKGDAPLVLAEARRVLVDGGALALSVKQGTGERWEAGPAGWPDRFFARYEAVELAALVDDAGFVAGPIRSSKGTADQWALDDR
jgi:ubiquinone/menaquinone biosynthesis C-methylase UbiE